MNWKDIHQSPSIRRAVIALGIAVVLLITFFLGEQYGFHRAHFSERFGDSFHSTFTDPRGSDRGMFGAGAVPGGHGAVGKVVSIALPTITVAEDNNLEKTIVISDDTLIRKFSDTEKESDIAVGDYLVVLGDPTDDGQIKARLIRIVPPPQTAAPAQQGTPGSPATPTAPAAHTPPTTTMQNPSLPTQTQ